MARILIPNYEFVENWSEDQLNNFVTLETFNSEIDEIKNAITWKSI